MRNITAARLATEHAALGTLPTVRLAAPYRGSFTTWTELASITREGGTVQITDASGTRRSLSPRQKVQVA
jgi:hypothetical protein